MPKQTKKKRGPFVFMSVACVLIFGLATIFLISNKDVGQTIAGAKGNQPIIKTTEIESPLSQIKLYEETYETSMTTYSIQYPQVEDETFNETILHFINTEKDNFLTLADNNKNVTKEEVNTFSSTVDVYEYNDRFYSFTFRTKTGLSTEDPYEQVSTFVYDKKLAHLISLEQLLDNNIRYLETLNQFVYNKLIKDEQLTNSLVDKEALKKVVAPLWDSYSTFAIENDKLVVYFQPGTVASTKQGIVSVSGKMSYLQSILAEPFRRELTEDTKTIALIKDNRKRVALTFDDGPHKSVTTQILNILDEFDAKATFFMLGKNIKLYPDIAKDVRSRGHEIGNHTWTHPVLTKLSIDEVKKEYMLTESMIVETLGESSTIFRPPYGATNDTIKGMIPTPSINWSLDTLDWKHRNASKTLQIVKKSMHNNAVILMHDIHQPTADGLRAVLKYLQDEGYEFLPVSEVLPYVDYNM